MATLDEETEVAAVARAAYTVVAQPAAAAEKLMLAVAMARMDQVQQRQRRPR